MAYKPYNSNIYQNIMQTYIQKYQHITLILINYNSGFNSERGSL